MKNLLHLVAPTILLASIGFGAGGAMAQAWPAKPVRLMVPLPPGGSVDTIARAFAQKFTEEWKQTVVVDNRGGAGGTIGADVVAKAAPDGYTFLINSTSMASSANLYRKLSYDALNDFAPVTEIIKTYMIMVSSPKVSVNTVKELIALGKAQPGKLNMGSTGTGSSPHLVGELLRLETGIDVVHIPYKGDVLLQPALISGQVHFAILPPNAVLQHIKSGRLRGLAVTGKTRAAIAPSLPTMIEAGVPDFEFTGWIGLFAPAGTPRDILGRVSAATVKELGMPDIISRVPGWGGEPAGTTPEEFAARYRSDLAKFARIVKQAHVPLVD